jgi:hypothetical protein
VLALKRAKAAAELQPTKAARPTALRGLATSFIFAQWAAKTRCAAKSRSSRTTDRSAQLVAEAIEHNGVKDHVRAT